MKKILSKTLIASALFAASLGAGLALQPREAVARRAIGSCVDCNNSGTSCFRSSSGLATCTLTGAGCTAQGECNVW